MALIAAFVILLLIMTLRAFLIVSGLYKDPVLRSFEHYGDEQVYSPMVGFIGWSALLILTAFIVIFRWDRVILLTLFFSMPMVWLYWRLQIIIRERPRLAIRFPLWYEQLVDQTTREERRRIAYLWLQLPVRTRLIYNASDVYFHQWTDLVLTTMA